MKEIGRKIGIAAQNIILLLFSISFIFPAIWLFYSSMKDKAEFYQSPIALPKSVNFDHYISILKSSNITSWILNTVRNSVTTLFFTILLGFIIGYFLSRHRFRGRRFLYGYFLLGMLVPVHALMVPMYVLFTKLGLHNHWYTLILPYTALSLPIAVFLVESYVQSIPVEIEEAAAIDGSSIHRTLFQIIMPVCKPILVAIGIIQFFYIWNEFTFGLILVDSEALMTVPVGLTLFRGRFSTDYPRMMTAMIISMLPAVLLYFGFSKQIMKGMVSGAVKG